MGKRSRFDASGLVPFLGINEFQLDPAISGLKLLVQKIAGTTNIPNSNELYTQNMLSGIIEPKHIRYGECHGSNYSKFC
jgi:hypothetical protein